MPELPAIGVDGPKGVGKTATGLQRANTVLSLDDPVALSVVRADPSRALGRPRPILVDEWQRAPEVWDHVRRAVDAGAPASSFLLTGSATPALGSITHSGAGRIVSLRMRPMALPERDLAEPTVSLAALLEGRRSVQGDCRLALADYAHEIEASGFPGIRSMSPRARRTQLDSYLTRALSRDLTDEQGVTVRRPDSLRAWATAYATATGSTATWETIRSAASPGDADPPSKATTIRYRDWLTALWLLDPVPAWLPYGTALKGLTKGPKHHLADPALAARLMKLGAYALLDGEGRVLTGTPASALGALFESLATLTVRVCAQAAEATTSHLRTERGEHEVDLIIERHDGHVLGIEVKLAASIDDKDVRHLHWLRGHHGPRVQDLIVVTTGPHAYRRPDGIAVVPLGLLGP
ncbi:MAG: ATP-binding protein [Micropruina sp.]|nr:ATP-binding protein [Micropruina sp.]